MRIRKNNLLPWFTDDHRTLPESYLASCRKFFQELSIKQQASSHKLRQNVARHNGECFVPGIRVKNRFQRKV